MTLQTKSLSDTLPAMSSIRISMAQVNPTVGSISANTRKIISYIERAKKARAHIVVFPELAVTGYPPEDLLHKGSFIKSNLEGLARIAKSAKGITAVVGFVDRQDGDRLYNGAAILDRGRIVDIYHKHHLPNYSVFDEKRYFVSGSGGLVLNHPLGKLGIAICEDIWHEGGTVKAAIDGGAEIILNLNASPFYMGKFDERVKVIKRRALRDKSTIIYTNLVGGQDELVFDGRSFVMDPSGEITAQGKGFREELVTIDIPLSRKGKRKGRGGKAREVKVTGGVNIKRRAALPRRRNVSRLSDLDELYSTLILGTRDYFKKNSFKRALIGSSGGIDSALVTALAVDALGAEAITTVSMPSRYSARSSRTDAEELAENLGVKIIVIPIEDIFKCYLKTLKPNFKGMKQDITEENLQARIRGNLLMGLSNKFGSLVLTTGNKSEMSVGYSTLYGDMAGGFAIIKDMPKLLVYELSEYINEKAGRIIIPRSILTKAPTAELRRGQRDEDFLPPYEVLDPILKHYIEENMSAGEITALGYNKDTVQDVIKLVDRSEYKRRQSPPGIKVTPRGLGKDRRMPITNAFRSS